MRYYVISGEASGDLHGAHLIKALKKIDPQAEFRAWGGNQIEAQGVFLVKHIRDLAFMGFWEVILHLPQIYRNIKQCKKDILAYAPDAIIYIDYPGFNLRIARWAKKQGFKNHYYISPQVWAWKENRVRHMKQSLDALYVILPFEKTFFEKKHHYPVHYVGHPLMDYIPKQTIDNSFFKRHLLNPEKPLIALLPGSRLQEIHKMLPLFIQVAKAFPDFNFALAAAPGISDNTYQHYLKNSIIVLVKNNTYGLLQNSSAALVTSGTATLETALFEVPQLVCYRSSALSYWIGKKVIKLRYISLVNLILDAPVVPELIQNQCRKEVLIEQLKILFELHKKEAILLQYRKLKSLLGKGGASEKTAQLIVRQLTSSSG